MGIDRTHIFVLNYNGRALLEECLPSVVAAAKTARIACEVSVVDNQPTDDSVAYLKQHWPSVGLILEPNRGLVSFNHVLARREESVAILLNNDVKLDITPLTHSSKRFKNIPDALFSAPLCWDFEGTSYEGMKTWVKLRYGLPQGLCRIPGHKRWIDDEGLTASAGPVLAVDRLKFLAVGGYDSLYFPGRLEDLDLGFQAWIAGWKGYYVPTSIAYHRGFGSFGKAFGQDGCDYLAARNTLLFAWKNLSGLRFAHHLAWLPARLLHSWIWRQGEFVVAFRDALKRLHEIAEARRSRSIPRSVWIRDRSSFFGNFSGVRIALPLQFGREKEKLWK